MASIRNKVYFTPVEATRTLPLVKRIVRDILDKGKRWKELAELDETLMTSSIEDDMECLKEEITEHMKELEQIGCSFRDWKFEVGLVDFPAKIDGEDVLLCWKSDEDSLEWYHDLHTGFSGRRRIPRSMLEDE